MTVNFPLTPNVGDEVTGPAGEVWLWDGTKWVAAGSGGGSVGSGIIVSPTAPDDPADHTVWWNSLTDELNVWYANQWVSLSIDDGEYSD